MIVQPGPLTRIGAVHVTVIPVLHHGQQIGDAVVRRLVNIDSGHIYRESDLAAAQRSLYQTNAYIHVAVGLDSAHGARIGGDSIAPLEVSLVENTMHSARVGVGYGQLDCFRASGEFDDYDFLSGARHLELQGRVSKIGIGKPLDGGPHSGIAQLCQQARHDILYSRDSTWLDYYVGATLAQPFLFGLNTVPTITAYRSRVSEYNAYVRTTNIGGIASLVWQPSVRTPITFSYAMDYGRTEAQPALFCAVFNLCDGEDRARVEQNLRLAVVSAVIAHDGSNSTTSPTAGGTARFEMRHASPWVFSDTALQFNTLLGDVARYVSLGSGNVLALHLRAGAVFGRGFRSNTGFIPPQERMYAGGPNSVRGFAQNDLGAVAYITTTQSYKIVPAVGDSFFQDTATSYRRVVPVGGNSLLVGNVELRLRSPVLPDVLQFALFVDAGNVWNRGIGLTVPTLLVTPGIQVAALTPIGPVRLVVGYNSYPLPKGPIYYENSSSLNGTLPCVSPGNTLPVVGGVQSSGSCPATFKPAQSSSFGSKLTFGLAIGQAF
jgi:outer membrane protein insertion porin family/translocation and assembly module TamA